MFKKNKEHEMEPMDDGDKEVSQAYGDLVTFIMMLFVLLFVMSYNENKNADFITEFQIKFGENKQEEQQTLTTDALLVSRIEHYIKKEDIVDESQVLVDEHRIKIILHPPLLFDSGKADLNKKGIKILEGIAPILDDVINPIIIEGHTDNIPISNDEFASNWELSFYRSFQIVKYFIHQKNYSPHRLSALGYGEHKPLFDNLTWKNRQKNRRIEINIIRVTPKEQLELETPI